MATIVLGTVQFGLDYGINNLTGKPDENIVHSLLWQAYEAGIRSLDTADVYGNADELIGSFHRKTGLHFAINTKFTGGTIANIHEKLKKSLQTLATDHIETYFYHSFKEYISSGLQAEINQCKKEKLINAVGVSVYTNTELLTAIDDPFVDVVQLPFNLLDNTSQRGALLKKAKQRDKKVQVRSVFLQGLFFKDLQALPVFLLPLKPYLQKIHMIAEKAAMPIERMCLQYAGAQTDIDEIVIGVDSITQLDKNIEALRAPLTKEVIHAIDELQVKETELLYPFNWK
jgi:aryl-alcohol dehydrogenase-like predicted oxidoreductase